MSEYFPLDSFKNGVFLVNCLAIILKDGKILMGRREYDPYIEELTWSFPGGRPHYGESLNNALYREVKEKTGLIIEVSKLLFARVLPERQEFLLLYYDGRLIGGNEEPGGQFVELKWVKPMKVLELATSSIDPWIKKYLINLEDSRVKW